MEYDCAEKRELCKSAFKIIHEKDDGWMCSMVEHMEEHVLGKSMEDMCKENVQE